MVKITVRGSRQVRYVGSAVGFIVPDRPQSNLNKWKINKRYRLNPTTGGDHDYNPDYYSDMIRSGSIEGVKIQNWNPEDGVKIRAIQTMLHLQTNYNMLLKQGLYHQDRSTVVQVLTDWYEHIAQQFPRYAQACRFELIRHLRRHQQREGWDFEYVAEMQHPD